MVRTTGHHLDCLRRDLPLLFVLARAQDVQDEMLDVESCDEEAWQEGQNLEG